MDKSVITITDHCTNCATTLTSASETFSKITVADEGNELKILEVAVLDAILYIYGFSATNLASAYLDKGKETKMSPFDKVLETSEFIVKNGLSLCNNCIFLFKNLYVAFHQLKKLSNEAALLTKAIKKFSPTSIKIEIDQEAAGNNECEDTDTVRHCENSDYSRKTALSAKTADSEEGNSAEELFHVFNFEQDDEEDVDEDIDIKTDPIAETKNFDPLDTTSTSNISSSNSTVENDCNGLEIKECSVHLKRLTRRTTNQKGCSGNPSTYSHDYMKILNSDIRSTTTTSSSLSNDKSNKSSSPKLGIENKIKTYERRTKPKRVLTEEETEICRLTLRTTMKKGRKRLTMKKYWKKRSQDCKLYFAAKARNCDDNSDRLTNYQDQGINDDQLPSSSKCLTLNATKKGRKKLAVAKYSTKTKRHNFNENDEAVSQKQQKKRKLILTCNCGEKYSTLDSLRDHEKSHEGQGPVTVSCNRCPKSFDKSSLLYVHKSWIHLELPDLLFNCALCDERFLTREKYKEHHELNHINIIEKKKFDNSTNEGGNEDRKLKCSCGKWYASLACLRTHENRNCHPQESAICDVCGKTFQKLYLMYGHKSIEHSELPQITDECKFCGKRFTTDGYLKTHIEQNHSNNPKSFICDQCGAKFNCLKYLKRHKVGIHNDEGKDKEQFRCKECGILLKHSQGLRKHTREMHGTQKTFVCEQCGKITKNMTNMRIHMKVHNPNRTVKEKPPIIPTENPAAASVMDVSQLGCVSKM